MKLPIEYTTPLLQARQDSSSTNNDSTCGCLSGGAIAGIVIGCVVGSWLLFWVLRTAFAQSRDDTGTSSYYQTRYDRPRRRSSSGYVSYHEKPSRSRSRSRRYHHEVDRPARVYLSGD